jgi:hypothetical protein
MKWPIKLRFERLILKGVRIARMIGAYLGWALFYDVYCTFGDGLLVAGPGKGVEPAEEEGRWQGGHQLGTRSQVLILLHHHHLLLQYVGELIKNAVLGPTKRREPIGHQPV